MFSKKFGISKKIMTLYAREDHADRSVFRYSNELGDTTVFPLFQQGNNF